LARTSIAASPRSTEPVEIQISLEEIKTEIELDALPDAGKAFEWSFVQN